MQNDKNNDIDYGVKVLNFMEMTGTNDNEMAANYLEISEWDEGVLIYFYIYNI